jgi:hypothetical protein
MRDRGGETGWGEGVCGLYRASQLAAMHMVIMRLRSIPAAETVSSTADVCGRPASKLGRARALQRVTLTQLQVRRDLMGLRIRFSPDDAQKPLFVT